MDHWSESRLSQVHPALAEKVRAMAAALLAHGIAIHVLQGLRTEAEQDALYAKGRTLPGEKVTNARGGYSQHNFGCAVDCAPGLPGRTDWEPDWNSSHPTWAAMVAAGEAEGLVSGSCWKTLRDFPHFQLPGLPVTPTDGMRADLAGDGLQGFWSNVDAGIYTV